MKRYRFRLATVLRVRSLQEDLARAQLREAGAALGAADVTVRQRTEELRGGMAADPAPGSGAPAAAYPSAEYSAAEYLATQQHRLRLAAGVREAQQVRDAAAERRDEARRAWATAARRVDALESLDARHRAEHDALVRADEDRVADDLVTARSTGRRRTR